MRPHANTLVLGGAAPDDLRATLASATTPPDRTFCAVGSVQEANAAAGLAEVHLIDPWPGSREALAILHARVSEQLGDAPVVVVAAGTAFRRRFLSRALKLVSRGAGVVMATPRAGASNPLRRAPMLDSFGGAAMARALFRPGSGMVLSAAALRELVSFDWLEGAEVTLEEVRRAVGEVRVLRGAIEQRRSNEAPASERLTVTVLIPAHDEEAWIGHTLRSIRNQTVPPDDVIVVDDRSTDRTGDVARALGARVVRTDQPQLRAGACNYALKYVTTDVVITIDADTLLHPEAIEHIMADFAAGMDATNGAVLPQTERGFWSKGRLVEYALAMRLYKRAQMKLGTVMVMSGCLSAFKTQILRDVGGFPHRTLTEDLDLTWVLHELGYRIGYSPKAIGYPAEPTSWRLYKSQMRRWAGGFYQSVLLHRKDLRKRPVLALMLFAAVWDVVMPLLLMSVLAVLVVLKGFDGAGLRPELKIVLFWQSLVIGVPLLLSWSVVGFRRAVVSVPAYAVISMLAQYFYTEAFIREFIFRKGDMVWVKGH